MISAQVVQYRRANKQRVGMTEDEVWRFVEAESTLFVTFLGRDGYPLVTPVNTKLGKPGSGDVSSERFSPLF